MPCLALSLAFTFNPLQVTVEWDEEVRQGEPDYKEGVDTVLVRRKTGKVYVLHP